MRLGILADIHGNLEALQAVLAHLQTRQIDRLVVLGDTIGYGPNPRECLEAVAEHAQPLLIGNHEAAALNEQTEDLGEAMGEVLSWSTSQVADLPVWQRWQDAVGEVGLDALAYQQDGDLTYLHGAPGAPGSPVSTYVWPGHSGQYLKHNRQLDDRLNTFLEQLPSTLAFCGHTHIPAVLAPYSFHPLLGSVSSWNLKRTFVGPSCIFLVPDGNLRLDLSALHLTDEGDSPWKLLVNPGSVGQPRDGDLRACYGTFDGTSLELLRLPYEVETTRAKVRDMPVGAAAKEGLLLRLGVEPGDTMG